MTAAASGATGAAQEASLTGLGGRKSGRGRWRDKRAGTLWGQALDGVEEFQGPRRALWSLRRQIVRWFQCVSRDFSLRVAK